MFVKVCGMSVIGMESYPVSVEVDISAGLPQFSTVGLPDVSVKESRDRIKAAIKNSGYAFPRNHVTVNLAPADIKKEGTGFDLPIAVGILAAEELISVESLRDSFFIGVKYILFCKYYRSGFFRTMISRWMAGRTSESLRISGSSPSQCLRFPSRVAA